MLRATCTSTIRRALDTTSGALDVVAMWIIWPFNKKNFGEAWNVCADFHSFVEPYIGKFIIQDEALLPHPKERIYEHICVLLTTETNLSALDNIKTCAFELPFFQKAVGPRPLHPLGIDLDRASDDGGALQATGPVDLYAKEAYDRFKRLRDADWAKMRKFMADASSPARAS